MRKKNLFSCFILILLTFILLPCTAQEKEGSNGKYEVINGLKIYYEDTGRGMPLILLHGFGSTASAWRPLVAPFSLSHRVIAIDLPGHGRSDAMDSTNIYLHKQAAQNILGLLDKIGIDSAYIMGISSGGFITLYMASLRPDLAKKIVIIGGQVYYSETTRKVIESDGPGTNNPQFVNHMTSLHGKKRGLLLINQFWNFRKLYGDPSFTPDVLQNIKAKTLIVHGDNDPIAPVSNAWEMFTNIPGAKLWVVPSGGHVPVMIPANREDFIRRANDFLLGNMK